MSIEIIRTQRRVREFLVYDLEWIPGTLQVRLVGVFDGKRYRCYRTVAAFIEAELNRDNRGKWFYAHAGGLADVQFVFEEIVRRQTDFVTKASFSGSSAIIVHVAKGKNSYHFVDSYWLLRDKLANIAKSIGMEKGGPACSVCKGPLGDNDECAGCLDCDTQLKDWFTNAPLEELIPYNELDCVILWKAIDQFQDKLWEFGGQLQMTLASSAMQLFRRRYLSEGIGTSDGVNAIARQAYVASRVEVFAKDCVRSNYYDINSSFPYAMTKPIPGECTGITYGELPDDGLYLAHCEVEVLEGYLPPLPVRAKGRVFFPTGRWEGWFNNVDIELLRKEYGRVLSVDSVYSFEPFYDLAEYAKDLYERRKKSTDEFERVCLKLLLNSLYGKFAESDEKLAMHINPSADTIASFSEEVQRLMPGVWLNPAKVSVPHVHVPISAHITAMARRTLYDFLSTSNDFHYCDTDGFSTGDTYKTSKELGGLKLEKKIDSATWVAPKLYNIQGRVLQPDGEWKAESMTKAKGFSLGRDKVKAQELFMKLVEQGEIRVDRMYRIRENFRQGNTAPREHEVIKRLQQSVLEKRFVYPDGATRPWTVRELRENVGEVGTPLT